jgi:TPP-dependent pyruvate/acetoin dehydrogenase alpha subunit
MTEVRDRAHDVGTSGFTPPAGWPPAPPPDVRLGIYKMMAEMREFERRAYDLFLQGLVKGTSHLGLGQEAVAAGFGAAMRPEDYTFATYRGHNHTLARGTPMGPVMAELMGRAGGLMAGKGGSMHLTSVKHRMMGSYAIVGAHLTIANGAAWSSKLRGAGEVAVCFFGDGTTNIGAFHEALNLAVVWSLPVVFVCENNRWMEYTPIGSVTAVAHPAADRAQAYGLDAIVVDGNDPDATYAIAAASIERARAGGGPALIEAETYRHGGHSRADPGKYRPEEEVQAWLEKDPIKRARERLIESGVDAATLGAIDAEASRAVDVAVEEALESPQPDLSLVGADVFSDGGAEWRR